MTEGKGVAMAILGIVALIAVVGLILMFSGQGTGGAVWPQAYGPNKLYGGYEEQQENPYAGSWVAGTPYTTAAGEAYGETKQAKVVVGGKSSLERIPSRYTTCPPARTAGGGVMAMQRADAGEVQGLGEKAFDCLFNEELNSWCCPAASLG